MRRDPACERPGITGHALPAWQIERCDARRQSELRGLSVPQRGTGAQTLLQLCAGVLPGRRELHCHVDVFRPRLEPGGGQPRIDGPAQRCIRPAGVAKDQPSDLLFILRGDGNAQHVFPIDTDGADNVGKALRPTSEGQRRPIGVASRLLGRGKPDRSSENGHGQFSTAQINVSQTARPPVRMSRTRGTRNHYGCMPRITSAVARHARTSCGAIGARTPSERA